jgi:hypothetical protein
MLPSPMKPIVAMRASSEFPISHRSRGVESGDQ